MYSHHTHGLEQEEGRKKKQIKKHPITIHKIKNQKQKIKSRSQKNNEFRIRGKNRS